MLDSAQSADARHRSFNLFAPKSSRIVRAMLTRPLEGWQVRQLAADSNVSVSPGLVVKVKRGLVAEGYAVVRERRLYLRDPAGLLNAWSKAYSGPAETIPLYFRGDVDVAEKSVDAWCAEHRLRHALGGFSAGWRLAPDVRYPVAAVYVEDRAFDGPLLDGLASRHGGKRAATGANLLLWRPFDPMVLASAEQCGDNSPPATSAVQTYLDLKRTAGRGEDAANAVFATCLERDFAATAQRARDWENADV